MGLLPAEMSCDFVHVLLLINAIAIAYLLGIVYIEQLIAATRRLLHLMNRLIWLSCAWARTGR